jgi:putative ABC transport system substrate-binding protein
MSSRREFITLLAARAQQAGKLPTIGFLGASTPSAWSPWTAAFVQRLRELGWIEGRTVAIEYRWAEGRNERYADIAAEFVRLKVEVAATKQVTSTIPIVFAIAVDPLGSGMVDSLARPGGNATGLSVQSTELAGKRLEILREALPNLQRLAIIGDVGYASSVLEMSEVQAAARKVRHAGDFVDKILKGTKPADIPVQQPTKFELVVNLTAAKALRVTIPETFLARADEVIE